MADTAVDLDIAVNDVVRELGLQPLKEKQKQALMSFLQGNDTFVSLPTGYGKSIIYAVMPTVFDRVKGCCGSIVVCISPLTAIMMDQKAKFSALGICAEFVGEMQTDMEVVKRVLNGNIQLLFISPESLLNNKAFRKMLNSNRYKERLVAIAVDEAHCVKTWGDDFRVAFSQIGELRSIVPDKVGIIALTATATTEILHVVTERLSLKDPVVIGLPPNQPNIMYNVEPLPDANILCDTLAEGLQKLRMEFPRTLIFCPNLRNCSMLYQMLRSKLADSFTEPPGYPDLHKFRLVDMYTRPSTKAMKEKVLASFLDCSSKLRIVIATAAFSMGIDCPNIRNVIHFGPPSTIEQYVQEVGRAGRDGKQSTALLLYGGPGKHVDKKMKEYGQNSAVCRRQLLFQNFLFYDLQLQFVQLGCKCCDVCDTKL